MVAQAIITQANSVGLAVIAEGVDAEAQRQFLDVHGYPICQGCLSSQPVALDAFKRLVQENALSIEGNPAMPVKESNTKIVNF